MNPIRCSASLGYASGARKCGFVIARFANAIDKTALSRNVWCRLPIVNHNRKGLQLDRPKTHQRVSCATKAGTHWHQLQCWLAREAAMENRHGPQSRTQAARTDHHRRL